MYVYCMKDVKQRKQVELSTKIVKVLQKLADSDKRKLKPFMEKVLEDYAKNNAVPVYHLKDTD